ncbi:hypothetical protein BJ912DRAFT_188432 [Pholiota molesta]|nr:hypothetical protein BJ912DRAFT_188432 [Pholiota molesta]
MPVAYVSHSRFDFKYDYWANISFPNFLCLPSSSRNRAVPCWLFYVVSTQRQDTPRDVPGIATSALCDGRNATGNCFSTSITPATLGLCGDFSGTHAFLADGGLVSVLAAPGFTLWYASEHNCVFTRGTSFSLEGGKLQYRADSAELSEFGRGGQVIGLPARARP